MSNSFLSVPAAYKSDQNWTNLPKIGEIDLSESPILDRPFRGAKLRCQLAAENSALLYLKRFFSKIGKTAGAIKAEFSVLTQYVHSFAHIYPHNRKIGPDHNPKTGEWF